VALEGRAFTAYHYPGGRRRTIRAIAWSGIIVAAWGLMVWAPMPVTGRIVGWTLWLGGAALVTWHGLGPRARRVITGIRQGSAVFGDDVTGTVIQEQAHATWLSWIFRAVGPIYWGLHGLSLWRYFPHASGWPVIGMPLMIVSWEWWLMPISHATWVVRTADGRQLWRVTATASSR